MVTIRIAEDRWAEVWRFLVAMGPITRISTAPLYEISPQHLEALCRADLPFERLDAASPVAHGGAADAAPR